MRLLVDSTVWVDFLRGKLSRQAVDLQHAIQEHQVLLGDLILAEVMRGVVNERVARLVLASLDAFDVVELGGKELAVKAAENYRILRGKGMTVRGTVDLFIGTWCIHHDVPLLHADRDFAGMEKHLGLRRWEGERAGT